jgi:MOSC domain-containing protein YiiM
MTSGKVLALYMTMPDMMRAGHRMTCDDIDCDPDGIIGDMNYESGAEHVMLLVSQKSYDIADEAGIVISEGVLLESIHVDIDLYGLKKGSVIELGESLLEVTGVCEASGYLRALAPELPELLEGNRGLFVRPMDYGRIAVGDEVKVIQEA